MYDMLNLYLRHVCCLRFCNDIASQFIQSFFRRFFVRKVLRMCVFMAASNFSLKKDHASSTFMSYINGQFTFISSLFMLI